MAVALHGLSSVGDEDGFRSSSGVGIFSILYTHIIVKVARWCNGYSVGLCDQ